MTSVSSPLVTVLIPVHNAADTLAETLDSLIAQTFSAFEVLLVDDASTDASVAIAASYRDRLAVRVLSLATNAGVAGALNAGLATIATPFIARIDGDDIARADRLERQWNFLSQNAQIDVCSSWMELFYPGTDREPQILAKPENDAQIKTALLQYCSMSHGASMFRTTFFEDIGHFNTALDFAEDYDLWCRGALLGKRYANIPLPLTRYRQHLGQVGQQKRQLQYDRDLLIKRKYISALLNGESPGNLAEFFSLLTRFSTPAVADMVVQQSMPQLLALAHRIPDQALFATLVSGCIIRHMRATSATSV
jgi:glycosyltransferase involved in cell wall biosynthesis